MPSKLHIILVTLQLLCLILILFTGPIFPSSFLLTAIFSVSVLFGLWAIAEMKFRVNIFPDLGNSSKFVTTGPYSVVRHPMYTSVLFSSLCLVLDEFTLFRILAWIILLIVMLKKSFIEDNILKIRFDEFGTYELKTRRLIPYIF